MANRIFKIIKIICIYLFIVCAVAISIGFAGAYVFGDKITRYAITEINKNIAVQVSIDKVEFSVFKKFPYASLEFRNVTTLSSKTFNKKDFITNTDTLLTAQKVLLHFNILDIIRSRYYISAVQIQQGAIRLYTDGKGEINYRIVKKDTIQTSNIYTEIKHLYLKDIAVLYKDIANKTELAWHNYTAHATGTLMNSPYIMEVIGNVFVQKIAVNNNTIISNSSLQIKPTSIVINEENLIIHKTSLKLNENTISAQGIITWGNQNNTDLKAEIELNKIESIKPFITAEQWAVIQPYNIQGKIKGTLVLFHTIENTIALNASFPLENISFMYKTSLCKATGTVECTSKNISDFSAYFISSTIKINSDIGTYQGDVSIENLNKQVFLLNGKYSLSLSKLFREIGLDSAYTINGDATGIINIQGELSKIEKGEDFLKKTILSSTAQFTIPQFTDIKNNLKISDVKGQADIGNNTIAIKSLYLIYDNSELNIKGIIQNYQGLMEYNKDPVQIKLNVDTDRIIIEKNTQQAKNVQAKPFSFAPNNIVVALMFTTPRFIYAETLLKNFKSLITINKNSIKLQNTEFETMGGKVDAEIFTLEKINDTLAELYLKGELENLDIKQLFRDFDNFDQSFIQSRHLEGKTKTNFIVNGQINNKYSFILPTLSADCNIEIDQGKLLNFEPLERLSSFTKIEELKDITFNTLKNDILIKDNQIVIPKMEINSNALNLTIEGNQYFNGDFDYRITILLSNGGA
ncbi:MAG: AsmA-like C-terminal region-containing protein, partial [Bacteroidales bacterium]